MKVAIFGLGYVGSTAAGCIASQGHEVVGVDVNEQKVSAVNAGRSPVREPGLDSLIAQAREAGRLRALVEIGAELEDCDIAIVCVGTPSSIDGAHDMRFVAQVTHEIADAIPAVRERPLTVAYRSTMRPGTSEQLILPIFRSRLGERTPSLVELVYNPEFLREATAIKDYFEPPKIVIGTLDGAPNRNMLELHAGIEAPRFHVGIREAEITKFVDNSWHATKVAFANEVGRICQLLGISAKQVHEIFIADTKLNISPYYTRPGSAFGGSCLPKDVRALQHIAADIGANTHVVESLIRSNEAHKHHQYLQVATALEPGSKVLLVGLAFKQGTDDLRESPAVDLARKLLDSGCDVDIYDPELQPDQLVGQNLGYAFAFLPTIKTLLVDRSTAESAKYDCVVATNSLIDTLELGDVRVIDISRIA